MNKIIRLSLFEKILGSGFGTGYLRFATGTWGSVLAFLIYFFILRYSYNLLIVLIFISYFLGIILGTKFEKVYGKDPKEFTLDEFTGSWISVIIVENNILLLIIAFFIWRILDISKPFPANIAENLHGGLGIMLDDVISGLYTAILILFIKIYIL